METRQFALEVVMEECKCTQHKLPIYNEYKSGCDRELHSCWPLRIGEFGAFK